MTKESEKKQPDQNVSEKEFAKTLKTQTDKPDPTPNVTNVRIDGTVKMSLGRPELPSLTPDKALWVIIRNRTDAISFNKYKDYMNGVMCGTVKVKEVDYQKITYHGKAAYDALKIATEVFLMQECGTCIDWGNKTAEKERIMEECKRLPQLEGKSDDEVKAEIEKNREEYLTSLGQEFPMFPYFHEIKEKLKELPLKSPDEVPPNCYGILRSKLEGPCLFELIWSYWHEEGMLVQTLNTISLRFQNKRGPSGREPDPLVHLDIDPLRPINNLLWGYIQDEQHRLDVVRRAYEYDHHYGLTLYGKAVPKLQPADSRSKFLEAFHNLLHLCSIFYRDESDTTVIPDGFPVLNALKDVHLLLAEGAHNQFGDLPSTARVEMMMEQWLLARPEMREFMGGRIMVPYPEPWMDRVDTMKKLQGWTDVTVTHFRDLGIFGEQILLSVRYGNWMNINDEERARLWAHYWKQEIQGYIHAYRAVTGVDLSVEPTDEVQNTLRYTQPSVLLRQRLIKQKHALVR